MTPTKKAIIDIISGLKKKESIFFAPNDKVLNLIVEICLEKPNEYLIGGNIGGLIEVKLY